MTARMILRMTGSLAAVVVILLAVALWLAAAGPGFARPEDGEGAKRPVKQTMPLSPVGAAYTVTMNVTTDEGLKDAITGSSRLVALQGSPPPTPARQGASAASAASSAADQSGVTASLPRTFVRGPSWRPAGVSARQTPIEEDRMSSENRVAAGASGGQDVDWMALLERAVAAHPHATPDDVRRAAPELRDWADKRLAKHIVLTRQRLAARGDETG